MAKNENGTDTEKGDQTERTPSPFYNRLGFAATSRFKTRLRLSVLLPDKVVCYATGQGMSRSSRTVGQEEVGQS